MRFVSVLILLIGCAGNPSTAKYDNLTSGKTPAQTRAEVIAHLNACNDCGCVQDGFDAGADVLNIRYNGYYSSYDGAYCGYDGYSGYDSYGGYDGYSGYDSYGGYDGYSGYDSYGGYDGYSGYDSYGGYDGYSGYDSYAGDSCFTARVYVQALVNANARNNCHVFDKP